MLRARDQATVKRKWSADKTAGPLVLLAEWVQKRLIQHGWPCDYVQSVYTDVDDYSSVFCVTFVEYRNRPPFTSAFWDAFDAVLRVVAHEKNLRCYRDGDSLFLDGVYHVNKYGVIRPGLLPVPF